MPSTTSDALAVCWRGKAADDGALCRPVVGARAGCRAGLTAGRRTCGSGIDAIRREDGPACRAGRAPPVEGAGQSGQWRNGGGDPGRCRREERSGVAIPRRAYQDGDCFPPRFARGRNDSENDLAHRMGGSGKDAYTVRMVRRAGRPSAAGRAGRAGVGCVPPACAGGGPHPLDPLRGSTPLKG